MARKLTDKQEAYKNNRIAGMLAGKAILLKGRSLGASRIFSNQRVVIENSQEIDNA